LKSSGLRGHSLEVRSRHKISFYADFIGIHSSLNLTVHHARQNVALREGFRWMFYSVTHLDSSTPFRSSRNDRSAPVPVGTQKTVCTTSSPIQSLWFSRHAPWHDRDSRPWEADEGVEHTPACLWCRKKRRRYPISPMVLPDP
jgi:hypothetical protein